MRNDTLVQIFKQKLIKTLHVIITIDTWSEVEPFRNFLGEGERHFIANGKMLGNIEIVELFECLAYAILNILMIWCIDIDKVIAVITNNESNVVSAVT